MAMLESMEVRMNARRQINMQFEHMILRILCCRHVRVAVLGVRLMQGVV